MALRRSRQLEDWFEELIRSFQEGSAKETWDYSNLTQLGEPTQIYCISARQGDGWVAVAIVAHMSGVANLTTRVLTVTNGLGELTELADKVDERLEIPDLGQQELGGRFVTQEITTGQHALLALASELHKPIGRIGQGLRVGSMTAIGRDLAHALWTVHYRPPLPDPTEVIETLGRGAGKRTKPQPRAAKAERPRQPEQAARGYAAQSYPPIWFGEPPHQDVVARIRGGARMWRSEERCLAKGQIDGVETYVYNSGLVLAATPDRSSAQFTVNQVFGVFMRSGLVSEVARDTDLIEVYDWDDEGSIKGERSTVRERNWTRGYPTEGPVKSLLVLPVAIASEALDVANACAGDVEVGKQCARLLSAETLLSQGSSTESFVMAWSLVETVIERDVHGFWRSHGRSEREISNMDWTAAQKIDLLDAVGLVKSDQAQEMHGLRKIRNKIVHELKDADEEEARLCVRVAAALASLPQMSATIDPEIAFV